MNGGPMKNSERVKQATVVDFMRDASFFAERGLRLSQRYDYEKALKCLRRAVELEPGNPTYLCQLASVLAETGQFHQSNDLLHQIVDEIDPSMEEIYFYLANNYANLEDFQMAEEMALRYLQTCKRGEYREDAEELLDYIYFELDLPPRRFPGSATEELYARHEQARKCLEEGHFLKAAQMLQGIVRKHPSFMPAWNNLALAYYYAGQFEKAIDTIEQTLERDPGNLHALCNLSILLSHHGRLPELVTLLAQLKKVTPLHHENVYKLATTLGILGQHEEAYRLYRRLMRLTSPREASTYHFAAISAYLTGREQQAIRWWQKAKQLDPESGVADYYLDMVTRQSAHDPIETIPYHYSRPNPETPTGYGTFFSPEDFKSDPMVRASLLWALQHGKDDAKQMVIQTLAMIGDEEAEATLRYFYKRTDDPELRELVLLALWEMGAEVAHEIGEDIPAVRRPVEHDSVTLAIDDSFAEVEQADMRIWATAVWLHYKQQYPKHPAVRNPQAWVAALEYLYAKQIGRKQTQSSLADTYGVSASTVAKCIKELSRLDLNTF